MAEMLLGFFGGVLGLGMLNLNADHGQQQLRQYQGIRHLFNSTIE
jgi:hypothetical protein